MNDLARQGPRSTEVLVFAGGGVAHTSGGVGTLMLYLMAEWAGRDDVPLVRVVDTRGQSGVLGGVACFIRALASLLWRSAQGRVGLVHVHMTTRGSVWRKCLLSAAAAGLGIPVIVHMHGADFMPFYAGLHPLARRVVAGVLTRVSHVVVLGDVWRRFLVDAVGVAGARVAVMMNGVRDPGAPRERHGTGAAKLLFLGRLGDRKGVPELLAAMASPAMLAADWTATVAGDGEVERFRGLVAQYGLAGRVTLPGWTGREQTARLLAEADVLVLPSHHEAMPIAVIEALANGLAVVATPVGVIPEVLTHGRDALLVPPGDPDALAAALLALVGDPALRRRLGDAGRAVFLARLDVAAGAEQMLRLYRATVGPSAAGRQLPRKCRTV